MITTSILFLATGLAVANAGYSYVGCFNDDVKNRAFSYGPHTQSGQTVAKCADHCRRVQNSKFFGLQNGDECFCGGKGYDKLGRLPEDRCHMCCVGDKLFPECDPKVRCGSGWVNSVYKLSGPAPSYSYVGCFQDGDHSTGRTMKHSSTSDKQTVAGCVKECKKAGYTYAGLQNGDECFCSKKKSFAKFGRLPEDRCNMCCQEKKSCDFRCGSGWVNSIYKIGR